jgi:hypothetical protein
MKINYKLEELYPGIFFCKITDMYDLCMTFCRVQEFYESPYKNIRNKKFSLFELMKTYSKDHGSFTYPIDWGGFNVPGSIVNRLYSLGIDDYNVYDGIIESIHKHANKHIEQKNHYYLIGANNDRKTIEHELCHAFYYLDKDYKKEVDKILKKLHVSLYRKMERVLFEIGYCKEVIPDEFQAYLITDSNLIDENIKINKRELINKTDVTLELKHFYKKYKKSLHKKS